MKKSIEQLQGENIENFMQNGPGLRYSYHKFVVARDRKRRWVLVGGLGGQGVGRMWIEEQEQHRRYAGYTDAPDKDSYGEFGTPEFRA